MKKLTGFIFGGIILLVMMTFTTLVVLRVKNYIQAQDSLIQVQRQHIQALKQFCQPPATPEAPVNKE